MLVKDVSLLLDTIQMVLRQPYGWLLEKYEIICLLLGNQRATGKNSLHHWIPWGQFRGGRYDFLSDNIKISAAIVHFNAAKQVFIKCYHGYFWLPLLILCRFVRIASSGFMSLTSLAKFWCMTLLVLFRIEVTP